MSAERVSQRQQLDQAIEITLDTEMPRRQKHQRMESILVTMTPIERIYFQTILSAEIHRIVRESKK